MSRGIPGRYVQIKSGTHQGKRGFAYNRDQFPEIIKKNKVCVWVPEVVQASLFPDMETGRWKQVLFDPESVQVIGYID
jgi:hypothetical protein